ncbi:DUF5682 family protein [Frankia nepalensis]|uniref:Uncharacterized protein n=1 Tax=Frankia nepalensis TaxID=1836974 RepID=A0A937RJ32_9ACTN|nr:hypothetical protein [Frankia nepalensis]MBL7511656.1 hypothetical protein [Frankia nepalensis]MBL7631102.1 hypothetical protein [Frankia nepalensis]
MEGHNSFGQLRGRLVDAAAAFAADSATLAEILAGLVDDVAWALDERLEIFPVCHHSPASALAMARRLREKRPKVIYLELCEDLRPLLGELRNCSLPVALQAFAHELTGFPAGSGPLSVIAPITEASAEYQAIAYALETPGVELVLVDWSADHLFQWENRRRPAAGPSTDDGAGPAPADAADPERDGDQPALHGDAVGVEIGDLRPRFAELEEFLLRHGRVRHWSEWWDQYVEQPLAGADHDTYRQAMALVGSLFRRLRPSDDDGRHARDEARERHMWTRIREHLASSGVDPADCLHVCGAFHAVSRVPEFGAPAPAADAASTAVDPVPAPEPALPAASAAVQPAAPGPPAPGAAEAGHEIPPVTGTRWLYGLIPSSHSAIEAQFGLAGGSVSIAAATWAKAVARTGVAPFRLSGQRGAAKGARPAKSRAATRSGAGPVGGTSRPAEGAERLSGFLESPPALDGIDEDELLGWSVDIVRLARRNGYLASTADAIAVFESSILLAGMRNRARPTPYDFQDAAVTCIEKDVVPGRRDVRRLCEILLGGDRVGQVGYDALPPLARDVHDRLAPLGLDLSKRTVQRALLDLTANPELAPCSHLLWMLRYLLPDGAVRPILGVRRLGERSPQESWDLAIGRHQRVLIELGYEAVTVEQALEQRLRRAAWAPDATAAGALAAVEDAVTFLDSRRLADELGARAVELLTSERTVDDAPEVLRRIRRLLDHYRVSEPTLPAWCEQFVTRGYAHYCTLLPIAFAAEDTTVRQVASMLGFLLTLENLALALGCDRAQLELAVRQSHPEEPARTALLWAAQTRLGQLSMAELRARCDGLLANPLVIPAFPRYLAGFVQALEPVPTLAPFVVEVISKAFARLPDHVLLPWLPTLIRTLRDHAAEHVPTLVREAGRTFPAGLADLDAWTAPWSAPAAPPGQAATGPGGAWAAARPVVAGPLTDLLVGHPATTDALAALLDLETEWPSSTGAGRADQADPVAGSDNVAGPDSEATALLDRFPTTAAAVAALIGR